MHNIDIIVSSNGPNYTQQIRDQLYPELVLPDAGDPQSNVIIVVTVSQLLCRCPDPSGGGTSSKKPDTIHIDDEDNPDVLYDRLLKNKKALRHVRECVRNSRGCVLLISLKQYLRELYSLTDA